MTLSQVKKNVADISVKKYSFQHVSGINVEIPSLGASWRQDKSDSTVHEIEFIINSSIYIKGSPYHLFPVFRGVVAGGLDCSKVQVKREDVVGLFGEPAYKSCEHSLSGDAVRQEWMRRNILLKRGCSIAVQTSSHTEVVRYSKLGVSFVLNSNVVHRIIINAPMCCRSNYDRTRFPN